MENQKQFVLPHGVVAWDQVLQQPLRFAPWPYSAAQLACILKSFRQVPPSITSERVIFAARWFIAHTRKKSREPRKYNPSAELARLQVAVAELQNAIKAVHAKARKHLDDNPSLGSNAHPPMTLFQLTNALHHFNHDNRFALRRLPNGSQMGRAEKPQDEWLIWQFWTAWEIGHGRQPPTRGWPKFRTACTEPLASFGLVQRSDKAWQDVFAKAKARAKTPE